MKKPYSFKAINNGIAFYSKKGNTIYYNSNLFESLNNTQKAIIILHEAAHKFTGNEIKADSIAYKNLLRYGMKNNVIALNFISLLQNDKRIKNIFNYFINEKIKNHHSRKSDSHK